MAFEACLHRLNTVICEQHPTLDNIRPILVQAAVHRTGRPMGIRVQAVVGKRFGPFQGVSATGDFHFQLGGVDLIEAVHLL
jgi:hypothetical protein